VLNQHAAAKPQEMTMDHRRVLVRAHSGEPVEMIVINEDARLIFVANPSSLDRIKSGDTWPVGVPPEDVFCFNSISYESLRKQWLASGCCLARSDWRRHELKLFSSSARMQVA
jgi:hypothetical protein